MQQPLAVEALMWSPYHHIICLRVQPWAEEGMALKEKAAGQGHAYAMNALGGVHHERKEHSQALGWFTKGAEAGLPKAMYNLGAALDTGMYAAAPDYPAALQWYQRAADSGDGRVCRILLGARHVIKRILNPRFSSQIGIL